MTEATTEKCTCPDNCDGDGFTPRCRAHGCGTKTTGQEGRYECPKCYRVARWTDGQSVAAGDPIDEFWCQTCGAESPLSACRKAGDEDELWRCNSCGAVCDSRVQVCECIAECRYPPVVR